MKSTILIIAFLVFYMTVNADEVRRSSNVDLGGNDKAATTYVVNHEFCSSCISEEEENGWKETLEEVHTYAWLKRDPRADLPPSFTICSSVMTTYGSEQTFFTLLGKDGNKWLSSFLKVAGDRTSFFHWKWADSELPPIFTHQWVRSCVAVNSESGLLQCTMC